MINNLKIEIITSFYMPKNEDRFKELVKSLEKNLNSQFVSYIHLFVDNNKCIDYLKKKFNNLFYSKIIICKVGKQPLYSDLFMYSNTLKNKICMIINSDIWLHSIHNIKILNKIDENKKVIFSITRHEHNFSYPLISKYQGSHDAFIFKSPINTSIIKHLKHKQNVWGSENVVLYELNKLKYKLYNPCLQIKIIHEHKNLSRDINRKRINRGDINGDGIFSVRSHVVKPCVMKI